MVWPNGYSVAEQLGRLEPGGTLYGSLSEESERLRREAVDIEAAITRRRTADVEDLIKQALAGSSPSLDQLEALANQVPGSFDPGFAALLRACRPECDLAREAGSLASEQEQRRVYQRDQDRARALVKELGPDRVLAMQRCLHRALAGDGFERARIGVMGTLAQGPVTWRPAPPCSPAEERRLATLLLDFARP
jgi:hypothetical protein